MPSVVPFTPVSFLIISLPLLSTSSERLPSGSSSVLAVLRALRREFFPLFRLSWTAWFVVSRTRERVKLKLRPVASA